MWEKLKRQPLAGLALAIAAGYVIAHFVIRLAEHVYSAYPDAVTASAAAISLGAAAFFCGRWLSRKYGKRRVLIASFSSALVVTAAYIATVAVSDHRQQKAAAEMQQRAERDRQQYVKQHPDGKPADYDKYLIEEMKQKNELPDR